ncbi:hypothetical protein D1872_251730 [compost metagenome]
MEHLDLLPKGHHKTIRRATPASGSRFHWGDAAFLRRLVNGKRHFRQTIVNVHTALWLLLAAPSSFASGDIKGSKLVTGTEKLIGDVTTWLMILAPIVSGLLIIYFSIRRSAADEMDTKKWNNRIIVAVVSCIGAVLGSATLNIIIGYYK